VDTLKTPSIKSDILSGFLVFLIALPLCLGIASASGAPPVAGILTAIAGGIVAPFLGSARLTIKGPAAGLIVIVLGAVTDLGQGDAAVGYHRALAVGVVAGGLQILLALLRAGTFGQIMPTSVVHGMLAAIGVIIISKQSHVLLGVKPTAKEPFELLAEIPKSFAERNPQVFTVGLVALALMIGFPYLAKAVKALKAIPVQLVVLLVAIPMAASAHLASKYFVALPPSIGQALAYPDFSRVFSPESIKYIIMFTLVGSIESLLTVSAVDSIDEKKRVSDLNRDLLAAGVANTLVACIGGIPMISEVVRSKANIDNGAKSAWSNFFHGMFLLLAVALIPTLLMKIPLAALAAMLVLTGSRLASVGEFRHALHVGREQLFLFTATMLVTLGTDLLIGVGAGLVLKLALHLFHGAPFKTLFKPRIVETREEGTATLAVGDSAVFTNFLALDARLKALEADPAVEKVRIDFRDAFVVDHTVQDKLEKIANRWTAKSLEFVGLDDHDRFSHHPLAIRKRRRAGAA